MLENVNQTCTVVLAGLKKNVHVKERANAQVNHIGLSNYLVLERKIPSWKKFYTNYYTGPGLSGRRAPGAVKNGDIETV